MLFIHIYEDISILLLFYDKQGTESEALGIYIGIAGPIFTQKNIKVSMGQQYPYSTR